MGNQSQKICKHESGKKWKEGCCSPNPESDERVIELESASEASFTTQTEAQKLKHSENFAVLCGEALSCSDLQY